MKIYIYCIMVLLFCFKTDNLFSQKEQIKHLSISNSSFVKEVENYIKFRKKEYPKLDSLGYISISLKYYNVNAQGNDIKYSYDIRDQYVSLNNKENNYPRYYTYISNKLVLIYLTNTEFNKNIKYSNRSKKRIIKKVNKSIGKSTHLIIRNEKGKVIINDKNFRGNEEFNIHGGITLSINANDNISIKKN